jgi:hypothetical protein
MSEQDSDDDGFKTEKEIREGLDDESRDRRDDSADDESRGFPTERET